MLATGETASVREFIEQAFAVVGRRIEWRGSGRDEVGHRCSQRQVLVEVDPRYFRPTEVDTAARRPEQGAEQSRLVAIASSFEELVDRDGRQ